MNDCINFKRVVEEENLDMKNRLLEGLLEQQIAYYEEIETAQKELRAFCHDIKNHYLCLDMLLKEHDYEAASKYLENMNQVVIQNNHEQENIVVTGNPVLDALLSEKIKQAQEHKIDIRKKINIKRMVNVADMNWCIIIGNAMDNAIEACDYLEKSKRWIDIQMSSRGNVLNCCIKNTTDGEVLKGPSPYKTRKTDAHNHGFGLRNIEEAVKKYQGILNVEYSKNIFSLTFLLCGV